MTSDTNIGLTDAQATELVRDWTKLLKSLKRGIDDSYRATDDPEDDKPGMCVTFGVTVTEEGEMSWGYQTGDNSYTGGAYGHPDWAVVYLHRRSKSRELAEAAVEEIMDLQAMR